MSGNRLRWGALGWVLTLQFFVVEAVVALQWRSYSYGSDVISDLGSALSPAQRLMNASFVLQAALILSGVVLLLPALRGTAARVAQVVLALAALGVLLVGVFPEDTTTVLHDIGAILYLAGGAIGLLALAYALRPRSEALGTTLAVLGLAGAAATVFFVTDVTQTLGRGTTERIAGYVVPIGLTLTAIALWRMARGAATLPDAPTEPSRREQREQARAEREQRALERDAALEGAAQRRGAQAAGTQPMAAPHHENDDLDSEDLDPDELDPDELDPDELDPDELDPDDPWATPHRRRDR